MLNTRKRGNQEMKLEQDLINFIAGLQKRVQINRANLLVYTNYYRNGHIFRSCTNFRGNNMV